MKFDQMPEPIKETPEQHASRVRANALMDDLTEMVRRQHLGRLEKIAEEKIRAIAREEILHVLRAGTDRFTTPARSTGAAEDRPEEGLAMPDQPERKAPEMCADPVKASVLRWTPNLDEVLEAYDRSQKSIRDSGKHPPDCPDCERASRMSIRARSELSALKGEPVSDDELCRLRRVLQEARTILKAHDVSIGPGGVAYTTPRGSMAEFWGDLLCAVDACGAPVKGAP